MKIKEFSNFSVSHRSTSYRKIPTVGKLQNTAPLVLVLGKDADTRLLYKSFLKMWNYRIAEAGGIEELLTIIEYLQPELILMDCTLSFEDNLETICRIRSNTFLRETPLILISGYSQPKIRALALKGGADDFLVKPLNFDALRINLQQYIGIPAQNERQEGIL
jgi:two-component system, NtrC family, response regulator HydG